MIASGEGEGRESENAGRLVDLDAVCAVPDLAAELFAL